MQSVSTCLTGQETCHFIIILLQVPTAKDSADSLLMQTLLRTDI